MPTPAEAVTFDWVQFAEVWLPVAAGAGAAAIWAHRTPQRISGELSERRRRARAQIEDSAIKCIIRLCVPGLTGLGLVDRVRDDPDRVAHHVERELRKTDCIEDLAELATYYRDGAKLDSIPGSAVARARRALLPLGLTIVAWGYFVADRSLRHDHLPPVLAWVAFGCAITSAVVAAALLIWCQAAHNSLAKLIDAHA